MKTLWCWLILVCPAEAFDNGFPGFHAGGKATNCVPLPWIFAEPDLRALPITANVTTLKNRCSPIPASVNGTVVVVLSWFDGAPCCKADHNGYLDALAQRVFQTGDPSFSFYYPLAIWSTDLDYSGEPRFHTPLYVCGVDLSLQAMVISDGQEVWLEGEVIYGRECCSRAAYSGPTPSL